LDQISCYFGGGHFPNVEHFIVKAQESVEFSVRPCCNYPESRILKFNVFLKKAL
jgi:hypothetical protein